MAVKTIPQYGMARTEALSRLREFGSGDADYRMAGPGVRSATWIR
jgi:hypothetical protein